jgi:hypothetical protein
VRGPSIVRSGWWSADTVVVLPRTNTDGPGNVLGNYGGFGNVPRLVSTTCSRDRSSDSEVGLGTGGIGSGVGSGV